MSRSYRKHSICGWCSCPSEKEYKQKANRRFRKASKSAIAQGREPPFSMNQVSDLWSFGKDGKQYFGDLKRFRPAYSDVFYRECYDWYDKIRRK